jgi:hypothetical protein
MRTLILPKSSSNGMTLVQLDHRTLRKIAAVADGIGRAWKIPRGKDCARLLTEFNPASILQLRVAPTRKTFLVILTMKTGCSCKRLVKIGRAGSFRILSNATNIAVSFIDKVNWYNFRSKKSLIIIYCDRYFFYFCRF